MTHLPIIPVPIQHSFCAAKWKWVTLHFGMRSNHSCYHPAPHQWELADVLENPASLHNTKFKQEKRKEMLNGQRPAECKYCWDIEDLTQHGQSDRSNFNHMFADDIESIISEQQLTATPSYLEVSFNNSCNLACSYCSPGQSSKWHAEISKYGPYPTDDKSTKVLYDIIAEDSNPYIDAFWKWLPEIYSSLKVIRITGGEPLMSNSADKILSFISLNENKNLTVAYNTNLCLLPRRIEKLVSQVNASKMSCKEFIIFTSCDTYGKQAEYIRDGFKWDDWCNSVMKIAAEKIKITVMVTFGILSVFKICDFITQIFKWRSEGHQITFSCSILTHPTHFDFRLLPDEFNCYWDNIKEYINTHTEQFRDQELASINNMCLLWDARHKLQNRPDLLTQFTLFFSEYDKRRNTNLITTFPELAPLYAK